MDNFLQQLINGLTLGSIYGLIAIGYTMVYGIIGMINFAHGDVFMLSAFIALLIFLVLSQVVGVASLPVAFVIVQFHAEVSTMPPISTMTKATGSDAMPTTCDRTRKMRSAMKAESMKTSP